MENNMHEDGNYPRGTRIIPRNKIITNHKNDLKNLLLAIAEKEGISVKDAAVAITNALRNVITTKDLT